MLGFAANQLHLEICNLVSDLARGQTCEKITPHIISYYGYVILILLKVAFQKVS